MVTNTGRNSLSTLVTLVARKSTSIRGDKCNAFFAWCLTLIFCDLYNIVTIPNSVRVQIQTLYRRCTNTDTAYRQSCNLVHTPTDRPIESRIVFQCTYVCCDGIEPSKVTLHCKN